MRFEQLLKLINESPDGVMEHETDQYGRDIANPWSVQQRPITFMILKDCIFYMELLSSIQDTYTHGSFIDDFRRAIDARNPTLLPPHIGNLNLDILETYINKHDNMTYDMRNLPDISGRLWLNGDNPYNKIISFWNKRQDFGKGHMTLIEALLDKFSEKPDPFVFEFIDNQADLIPYDSVFSFKKPASTSEKEISDLKAQAHVMPGLSKKWADAIRRL